MGAAEKATTSCNSLRRKQLLRIRLLQSLPLWAPQTPMNGGQPIVPPKSNAPMPPMMMSPLLPEAVPTKTEKSRTDANKSLLTEPAEVVQPERADPPSPSDKKGTRLPSEEELKPKQPSERIEFPTPGDKSPKVDDDDLLSYVPRTPQNMVYHSAPPASPLTHAQPVPYGVQPMPYAAQLCLLQRSLCLTRPRRCRIERFHTLCRRRYPIRADDAYAGPTMPYAGRRCHTSRQRCHTLRIRRFMAGSQRDADDAIDADPFECAWTTGRFSSPLWHANERTDPERPLWLCCLATGSFSTGSWQHPYSRDRSLGGKPICATSDPSQRQPESLSDGAITELAKVPIASGRRVLN